MTVLESAHGDDPAYSHVLTFHSSICAAFPFEMKVYVINCPPAGHVLLRCFGKSVVAQQNW